VGIFAQRILVAEFSGVESGIPDTVVDGISVSACQLCGLDLLTAKCADRFFLLKGEFFVKPGIHLKFPVAVSALYGDGIAGTERERDDVIAEKTSIEQVGIFFQNRIPLFEIESLTLAEYLLESSFQITREVAPDVAPYSGGNLVETSHGAIGEGALFDVVGRIFTPNTGVGVLADHQNHENHNGGAEVLIVYASQKRFEISALEVWRSEDIGAYRAGEVVDLEGVGVDEPTSCGIMEIDHDVERVDIADEDIFGVKVLELGDEMESKLYQCFTVRIREPGLEPPAREEGVFERHPFDHGHQVAHESTFCIDEDIDG